MIRALRKRAVALLWCGQAMSSIGDEIYRVALIWLAVGLVGPDTGYLAATQALAWLIFGMIGGSWADRWDHLRTMVRVDLLRAVIVFIPVILFHFMPISLPILGCVAFAVAGLGAFFDPALMATIPRFSEDSEALRATTGLMSTTFRLARAIGPTIVGLLAVAIPMIHFFTLDAASFLISAISITLLLREPAHRVAETQAHKVRPSFRESLVSGYRAVQHSHTMKRILLLKSIGGGFWYLVYGLGTALYVQKLAPGDTRAFGLVVGSYGVGNFAGAVILGNMKRSKSVPLVFWGYLCLGIGFIGMGLASSLSALMLGSMFSGFAGPMNDLPVVDMIQTKFPIHEIPKIFRLRMAGEIFASLLCFSFSPMLFRAIPVGTVICLVGGLFLLFAVYGFTRLVHVNEAEIPKPIPI